MMNSKEFNHCIQRTYPLGIDVPGKDPKKQKEIIEDLTRLFKDASDKR